MGGFWWCKNLDLVILRSWFQIRVFWVPKMHSKRTEIPIILPGVTTRGRRLTMDGLLSVNRSKRLCELVMYCWSVQRFASESEGPDYLGWPARNSEAETQCSCSFSTGFRVGIYVTSISMQSRTPEHPQKRRTCVIIRHTFRLEMERVVWVKLFAYPKAPGHPQFPHNQSGTHGRMDRLWVSLQAISWFVIGMALTIHNHLTIKYHKPSMIIVVDARIMSDYQIWFHWVDQ